MLDALCNKNPDYAGSPMLVDTSFQSQHEVHMDNNVDIMNVGDYAEDIHQYLREAEVSGFHKPMSAFP